MSYGSLELHLQVQEQCWQDVRRDVDKWRLLRGARRRSGWLAQQPATMLCQLGRWLVRVGQALQSYGQYERNWFSS
jgi:hypothetical protein